MAITANSGAVSAYSGYSPPTINGQNAYDLQSQQAATSNEAQRQSQQAALARRMAAQGLSGSGIEEKGTRNTDVAAETANAQQQGAIQQTELTQAEADQQAALQRAAQEQLQSESIAAQEQMQQAGFGSQSALQTQEIGAQEQMQQAGFGSQASLQAAQLASQAALQGQEIGAQETMQGTQIGATAALQTQQIASTEKIQADAQAIQQQGMTIEQAQLEGYTDANGNFVIGSAELAAQGLTVQQAQVEGYTDPTTGQHVPGSNELTAMGQTNQMNIAQLGANEQTTLQQMVNSQQTGMADLNEGITLYNQQVTATAKSYYDQGVAKTVIDPATLANLQQTDPISYQSYEDGLAGRSLTEWQNGVTNATNYQNALLLDASKMLGTPGGQAAITSIFNETTGTGVTAPTTTGTSGTGSTTSSTGTSSATPSVAGNPAFIQNATPGNITSAGNTTSPLSQAETQKALQTINSFNPNDLSKYDFSTGQIYTNVSDFNNPAYTDGDNMVFTNSVTTMDHNTGGQMTVPPGAYTVTIVDATRNKDNTSDTFGSSTVSQPIKITRLVNKDDPSLTYDVYQEDIGSSSTDTNLLSLQGAWNNKLNPLSSDFWNSL
jgi:hypothetical protein